LIPLAKNVKEAIKGSDTLVMGTGSIVRPEEADQMIANGACDLVAVGRALLADSHWVTKAKEGKPIRPCIRCNVCHHQLFKQEPLVCSVNPFLLREAQEPIQPTSKKKKVMVVGAGPAGINAALAASSRGHDVALYEKGPHIGGMVRVGSTPACKEDVRPLLEFYEAELAASGVEVKMGVEVTPELIQEELPDALVIAVGGKPKMPDIIGIDGPNVVNAIDALQDSSIVKGEKVVVIGGGDVGCETACYLADKGKEVTIVEILPDLMTDQEINNVKMLMFPLLREKGIGFYTTTTTEMIHEDGIEVNGAEGRRSIPADTVVIATGLEPQTVLSERLRLEAREVYIVGDCGKLGRIREATRDGDSVGRMI
jgi:2-enoate reductase